MTWEAKVVILPSERSRTFMVEADAFTTAVWMAEHARENDERLVSVQLATAPSRIRSPLDLIGA